MAQLKASHWKQSFSTRISPLTLDQLDHLVRAGQYPNRTAAIEAAVARLSLDAEAELDRRRRAVEATRGALALGITPESLHQAEEEFLDWLGGRLRVG